MEKLVIIGSGSGGLPAASMVAKYKPDSFDITVITRDSDIAYSPCGIPFVLKGDIPSYESLIMRTKEHYSKIGIKILTDTAVEEIDARAQKIRFKDTWLDYDCLVIATGTAQRIPGVKGVELKGVFSAHIKTLKDAQKFEKYISMLKKPLKAVITGSGSIDLEVAVALKERGHDVTVVEKAGRFMLDRLDRDMAEYVGTYLQSKGIRILTSQKLLEIKGKDRAESVIFEDYNVPASIVLLGTDFMPEVTLARKAGFDIEYGIKVDEKSRVFKKGKVVENVFASGACAQVVNKATGRADFMYFGSTSIQSARVVAEQLLGKNVSITASTNPRIAVLWDMYIGAVGLTSTVAAKQDIEVICGFAKGENIARYYPGGVPVYLKLLFEKSTQRLIGAQVLSIGYDVKERVDALSIAMKCGLTAKELAHLETSYTPPVATIVDVVVEAANKVWLLVGDED